MANSNQVRARCKTCNQHESSRADHQLTSWNFFRFTFITFNFVLFALLPFVDVHQTCRIGMRLSHGAIARILCPTRFPTREYLQSRMRRGHTQIIDFNQCHRIISWFTAPETTTLPYCLVLVNLAFVPISVHLGRCYLSRSRLFDRHHFQFHRRRPISVAQQLPHLCSPFNWSARTLFARNDFPPLRLNAWAGVDSAPSHSAKYIYKTMRANGEPTKKGFSIISINRSNSKSNHGLFDVLTFRLLFSLCTLADIWLRLLKFRAFQSCTREK